MTDTHIATFGTGTGMIHVPKTAAEMKPPRPADLTTETANFLREHWDEVVAFFTAISGETPTIHGSITFDEAACIFKIQALAKDNGYSLIGTVPANRLRRVVRTAYKRNTGVAMRALENQNRNLKRLANPDNQLSA
jgi:hypothetical protein